MSARGKGQDGLRKRSIWRRKIWYIKSVKGVSLKDTRRLARRGGVQRLFGLSYFDSRERVKIFLKSVLCDAMMNALNADREFITIRDVAHALMKNRVIFEGIYY